MELKINLPLEKNLHVCVRIKKLLINTNDIKTSLISFLSFLTFFIIVQYFP